MTTWRKSTYSDYNGNCVQVARIAHEIAVRDSKNPDSGIISLSPDGFGRLIRRIKADQRPD